MWLRHYYRHPDIALLKLAVAVLTTERAFVRQERGWNLTGLLAATFKKNPELLRGASSVADFRETLDPECRSVLSVALWLAGDAGMRKYVNVDSVTAI